jgi:hypothetical protein
MELEVQVARLRAGTSLTAEGSPMTARRWTQLTARRSVAHRSPLDCSTAHGSLLTAWTCRSLDSLRSLGMTVLFLIPASPHPLIPAEA